MSRRWLVPVLVLGVAVLLGAIALTGWIGRRPAPVGVPGASPTGTPAAEAPREPPDAATDLVPLRRESVLVYFPAASGDGLVGEEREIFGTSAPGDRVKQILSDMLAGPTGATTVRAVPQGTQLRQVYVLDSGVAYVDFSAELKQGIGGGSAMELLTVYAIVNSVALNVPEIHKVGILVEGRPIETLNGHLDLRRPLPPNRALFTAEAQRAEPVLFATTDQE